MEPNRRILVIDDNPAIHGDFRKILSAKDAELVAFDAEEARLFDEERPVVEQGIFQMDSAYHGQEGLELVRQAVANGRPYALAFVDARMPCGWDAIKTIAHIWQVDPELQVVICTAHSDYSWEEVVARLGQSDSLLVLKKPFENIEVVQLAYALSKKWLLARQLRAAQTTAGSSPEVISRTGAGKE